MTDDILERAKIARYDMECLNCFVYKSHEELIAEVERLRALQDADILCQKINSDADYIEQLKKQTDCTVISANHRYADLQQVCDDQEREIERLRSELVEITSPIQTI